MDYCRANNYIVSHIRSQEQQKKLYSILKEFCFGHLTNECSRVKIPLSKQTKFHDGTGRRSERKGRTPFVEAMKEHSLKYAALTENERSEIDCRMEQMLKRRTQVD